MSELTIKLDLETLRALFGGEDKPSVEFRNSIANKFAGEYLKTLVTSSIAQQRDAMVLTEITRVLKASVLEDGSWSDATKMKLQVHYKNMIAITIDTEISNHINKRVAETNSKIEGATQEAAKEISKLRNSAIESKVREILLDHNIEVLVKQLVSKYIETFASDMLLATITAGKTLKEKG